MNRFGGVVVIGLLSLGSVSVLAQSGTNAGTAKKVLPPIQEQLKEANASFSFWGEPIHALGVQDLMTLLSDGFPGPVAIDVLGTYHSNRYFGDSKRHEDGTVSIELKDHDPQATGRFRYRRIGTLANGIHVLLTLYNGGGSGDFYNLLLVKFVVATEFDQDAKSQPRLVMQRRGEIPLGERYTGKLTVKSDRIEIGADPKSSTEARVLRFQ